MRVKESAWYPNAWLGFSSTPLLHMASASSCLLATASTKPRVAYANDTSGSAARAARALVMASARASRGLSVQRKPASHNRNIAMPACAPAWLASGSKDRRNSGIAAAKSSRVHRRKCHQPRMPASHASRLPAAAEQSGNHAEGLLSGFASNSPSPATFGPSEKTARAREAHQARSKRSRFITLVQAATKSRTSFSLPSALA